MNSPGTKLPEERGHSASITIGVSACLLGQAMRLEGDLAAPG
jgi:hypothetical protein